MCEKCSNSESEHGTTSKKLSRRDVLMAGAGIAAAAVPIVAGLRSGSANAATPAVSSIDKGNLQATTARGWAARSKGATPAVMNIERRAVGPDDVQLQIMYCGVCHSDLHMIDNDWGHSKFPIIPGHEIIGRVTAVGKNVTKFKPGDIGGVGCLVNSCGVCEMCLNDREQTCLKGSTLTYNSPSTDAGGVTYGGYSTSIVVTEGFVIRIPPGADLAGTAPILCAGITTFSPIHFWGVKKGMNVGVIGLGGLGHMAVKLAVSKGANVTVFTTTPAKRAKAIAMGAKDAILWSDSAAMTRLKSSFDFMIAAVPQAFDIQQFMNLLKLDATLVNVGALEVLAGFDGMANGTWRRRLAGSMIGGIAETQEVIDYCTKRNITADVEVIKPAQLGEAFSRMRNKDIQFRFVLDMSGA